MLDPEQIFPYPDRVTTDLLAEAAVDALGHVDVVSGGPPRTVSPLLRLYRDGLLSQIRIKIIRIRVRLQKVLVSDPNSSKT